MTTCSNPVWHQLFIALSNLYTMVTRDRGFDAHPQDDIFLSRLVQMQKLPSFSNLYLDVGNLLLKKNFIDTEKADQFDANRHSIDWIVENMRMVMFAQPLERQRKHVGINYDILFVVFTKRSGENAKIKVASAISYMQQTLAQLQGKKRGRILRLVCDNPLSYVVSTYAQQNVSVETWFVPELQLDPTLHVDVPEHRVFDQMTPDELAKIPKPLRQAAARDKTKLDVLSPTDMMSRWYGFVCGQTICVTRRHKLEFGCTYNIRFVR